MVPKSILIAEDNDTIAMALGLCLEQAGYRTGRVADAGQILDTVRRERPDLVMLDLLPSGQPGFGICQRIRADGALAATRILLVTARGDGAPRAKGLALGADAVLSAPFTAADILGEVDTLLRDRGG